jgi:hypothetical protein
MILIPFISVLLSLPVVFGTDGGDVPVAPRLLENGSVAIVLQTFNQDTPLSYGVAIVPPDGSVPEIRTIETGMVDPLWTRGCCWTSDSTFAILLSTVADAQNLGEILICTLDDEPGVSSRTAIPAPDPRDENLETGISSLAGARPAGFLMTVDRYADGWEDLQVKTLLRLGPLADTIWSAEVPCTGWWMNQDLLRPLPDGGCAVASDEDGFSETLFLSRFSPSGGRLWSLEYATGGEMTHSMTELLPAPSGGLLAVGVTDLFSRQDHTFLLLIDSDGVIVSERIENGSGQLCLTCGLALPDGRFLLAGWTSEASDTPMSSLEKRDCIMVLGADGSVDSFTAGSAGDREPCFLLPDGDGVVIVGTVHSDEYDLSDLYVERLDDIP